MTPRPSEARGDLLRVGLLGLNAWAVVLAIPALDASGARTAGLFAALLGPLAALALALAAIHTRHAAQALAALVGFPAALALGVGARPELQRGGGHTTLTLCLAVLSFLAWAVAAAHTLGRPTPGRATTVQPLGSHRESVPERRRRAYARRALLGVASAGAFALTAVAPTQLDRDAFEQAWGAAADEGALLATVVGSALAALMLGGIVGPALRAERRPSAPRPAWLRVVFAVAAFATGVAAWAVYARAR